MTAKAEKKAHVWARDDLDWYVEPPDATEALCGVETFDGPILDPACGQGNIVRALRAAGHSAWGTDIRRRCGKVERWFAGEFDFLADGYPIREQNFCTNPPFFKAAGAEAFIRKALDIAEGKVCAFTDIRFIAGIGRAKGLFAEYHPTRIWIIAPRPSCPPGDYLRAGGKASGGSSDWVWLVWDKRAPKGGTQVGWLRRGH